MSLPMRKSLRASAFAEARALKQNSKANRATLYQNRAVAALYYLEIVPIAMEEKLRFAIREGGRTVGAGVVASIIE